MLHKIRIRQLSKKRVEITFLPTWLGRLVGAETRVGRAFSDHSNDKKDARLYWWWDATGRWVGSRIERHIEAAAITSIEDMSVEMLLTEGEREKS